MTFRCLAWSLQNQPLFLPSSGRRLTQRLASIREECCYETIHAVVFVRVSALQLATSAGVTQFQCSDPWSIVSLAFFLRYPNPYASHVVSCDVISRSPTSQGTLLTTRLILKRGAMPKWAPKNMIARAESWVIEESEVDPFGKVVKCITKNLDHVKVMQVEETTELREVETG